MFENFTSSGVIGAALTNKFELKTVQLSEFSPKSFKGVDGAPYGGGPGMVLRADVLEKAMLDGVVSVGGYGEDWRSKVHVIFTSPRGIQWNNQLARKLAADSWTDHPKDLVFICGRYEGIDERFIEQYVDAIYSLGDYVLSGGELAVQILIDSALRFHPEILGNKNSAEQDSFEDLLIEHPQYTRPAEFNGQKVPSVLTSGNHKEIEKYLRFEKERMTRECRPDLYAKYRNKKG